MTSPDGSRRRRYVAGFSIDQAVAALVVVLLAWVSANTVSPRATVGVVGVAATCKFTAALLVGGTLSDLYGTTRVVRYTLALRVALLAALAVGIAHESVGALLVFAAFYGLVDGAHEPAWQAMSMEVAAQDAQVGLQATLDLARRAAQFIAGPAVGVLAAWLDPIVGVFIAGPGLIAAWLLLPRLHQDRERNVGQEREGVAGVFLSVATESVKGWRVVLGIPGLTAMLGTFGVANLCLTPSVALGAPLLAVRHGWGALPFGVVEASYVAGAFIGFGVMRKWGDAIRRPLMVSLASLVPTGALVVMLPWATAWPVAALLMTGAGVSSGFAPTLLGGAIKKATPAEFQARVQGARIGTIIGAGPVGFVVLSALTAVWSLQVGIASLGALLVCVSAAALAWRSRAQRELVSP